MKFSHTLKFNAVPEWAEHYVAYDYLKSVIFDIEKRRVEAINSHTDTENGSSRWIKPPSESDTTATDDDNAFVTALDAQLEKVAKFFTQKEVAICNLLDNVDRKIEACPEDPYPGCNMTLYTHNSGSAITSHRNNTLDNMMTMQNSTNSLQVPDASTLSITTSSKLSQQATVKANNNSNSKDDQDHDCNNSNVEKRYTISTIRGPTQKASFESRLSAQTTNESESYVEYLLDLRMQLIQLYVLASDLESFVDLNKTAFNKILKKYDKVLVGRLRKEYMDSKVLVARPFTEETANKLHYVLERTERFYADMFCDGHTQRAVRQMKTHLRDQVSYERNTVWKDMVSQERQIYGAHINEPKAPEKVYRIPLTKFDFPAKQLGNVLRFLLALIVFVVLVNVNIFGSTEESRCFALLIFAAMLWATEAVPLYATSLLIPFLIVPLGVMRNEDRSHMPAPAAAKEVFASMFSGTIMMLLSGFGLAGALSKYGIAKAFATHVLSRAGTRPRWVLLSIMFVAAFLSMWISNVATPVLCFSLIDPILRTLPDNSQVAPCLLLGIALASCIGGMTSPISSPQNIITLQYMNPSPGWGIWFAVALPISIISIFVCWILLLLVYRPDRVCAHLNTIKPTKGKITIQQVFVLLVAAATIILWCVESSIEDVIGDTGVIAAIPLFVFFGTGILGKDDLNAFLWSVVILAQGGMALGHAVTSSGLLQNIALHIKSGIQHFDAITILIIFSSLILVFATFVSHTVAALIIVPIVQQVGQQLPHPHPNLLVMGAGLACSAGMGLPVSGFPNMSAVMLEDRKGKQYLTTRDFIVTGVPTSIFCTIFVCTLGYGILSAVGY
ncbi:SPX domain-containing protein [Zychaea mexicana]|uniref:SPX domain-containing protein n=1 Tax=Zychaea mexicana TaxID=64656 RepID=UPI0022FDF903|nr:SPX domain-containing protein [Zychaea mexicana]KAI9498068.1 SPX domain-containing protein [Zychaea mexicana]